MKDFGGKIQYKGNEYRMVFNLNVIEEIQAEYGTMDRWASMTDGSDGEPNVKAVIFGITQMINEAADIDNEENGTDIKPLTHRQVGRLISEVGLLAVTRAMNQVVIDSTKSDEDTGKNG